MYDKTLAFGLIFSLYDRDLLNSWFHNHIRLCDKVYIAVDTDVKDALNIVDHTNQVTIFNHPLNDDFANMRNAVMEVNECDWICFIDADEIIMPDLALNLRHIINTVDDSIEIVGISRINLKAGKIQNSYPDTQYRLLRKNMRWHNQKPEMGASPGNHEIPISDTMNCLILNDLNILHYKPNPVKFRDKQFYKDK